MHTPSCIRLLQLIQRTRKKLFRKSTLSSKKSRAGTDQVDGIFVANVYLKDEDEKEEEKHE